MPFTFNPVIIIGFVGLKSSSSRMRLVPRCGKSSFSHQLNVTSIRWINAIELLSFNGSYQSSQAGLGYAKNPLKRLYCSTVCIGFTNFSMYINLTLLSFGMTARRLVITVRWSSVIETILKLLRVLVQAHSKSIAPTGSGRYEDLAPMHRSTPLASIVIWNNYRGAFMMFLKKLSSWACCNSPSLFCFTFSKPFLIEDAKRVMKLLFTI